MLVFSSFEDTLCGLEELLTIIVSRAAIPVRHELSADIAGQQRIVPFAFESEGMDFAREIFHLLSCLIVRGRCIGLNRASRARLCLRSFWTSQVEILGNVGRERGGEGQKELHEGRSAEHVGWCRRISSCSARHEAASHPFLCLSIYVHCPQPQRLAPDVSTSGSAP
jgi:hypothetical protein